MDETLSLKGQIAAKCRTALFNLSRIKSIRKYLDINTCNTLAVSLILSHLDYTNILYYGLPDCDIKKLQRVQNMAAKLVLKKGKYESATKCLKTLHWLPIKSRIIFKIAVYVFKCLHELAPSYLCAFINIRLVRRGLRAASADAGVLLVVPHTRRKTFQDRSFSVAAPVVWNSLPNSLRIIHSIGSFKKDLKTYLFNMHFN